MKYLDEFYFYDEALISENPTFVEVGSVTGINAKRLKKEYPNAKVIVYEASSLFPALEKQIKGLDIIAINKAVSGIDGMVEFNEYDFNTLNTICEYKNKKPKKTNQVESVSIKSMNLEKIDVLFLNCEGAEIDILNDFLKDDCNIRQISLSFHPHIYGNKTMETMKQKVIAKGYDVIYKGGKYNYYLIKKV